jgi:4-amino-4-deoxy-L-arabinose transferase-like glycosyltransferase
MSRRFWILTVVAIFAVGVTLRVLWLRADPPVTSVGIVWHDEGAWTHNARNLALWGQSRTDNWNPVYIAPIFTALEYGSFRAFGVGTWQARVVPVVSGLAAIVLLMAGLNAIGGRKAALVGGILLATNYWFVMWNRAALMESTMTAFLVAAWAAYALAERRPWWGLVAGTCAALAFFTKAAAAFFVAAMALDALLSLLAKRRGGGVFC